MSTHSNGRPQMIERTVLTDDPRVHCPIAAPWGTETRRRSVQDRLNLRYAIESEQETQPKATPIPATAPVQPAVWLDESSFEAAVPSLLQDLRDRKVAHWMVAYLAGAWMLLQVMDVLAEIWAWPILPQQVVSLTLGLGVFPAFVLTWYHGEKGRQQVTGMEATLLAATLMSLVATIWCVCLSDVMG